MGAVLSYTIAAAVILLCCYLPYKWLMANRKQYAFNRLTILAIYGLSALLPFILFRVSSNPQGIIDASTFIMPDSHVLNSSDVLMTEGIYIWKIISISYTVGFICVSLFYLLGVAKIMFIISKSRKVIEQGIKVDVSDDDIYPFSWGNIVIVSRRLYESNEKSMVITHESAHIRKRHFIDLLISQIVTSLQWFNPAAWMLRNCLKEVHEFQADEYVLHQGVDSHKYQLFLVSTAFSSKFNLPVDFLNAGNIRKKLTMMNGDKTTGMTRLAAISLLPFLYMGIFACNTLPVKHIIQQIHDTDILDSSHTIVDNTANSAIKQEIVGNGESNYEETIKSEAIPKGKFLNVEYIGGEAALMKFLMDNITYPKEAEANHTQGKVVVAFEISAAGDVLSVSIDTSVDKYLDEEALRACRKIAKFKPATLNGSPIASVYLLPITFNLPQ